MRTGEEYDYFFEVDDERRYDFDCEYDSVEIIDARASSQAGAGTCGVPMGAPAMMALVPGQIIIAN